MKSFHSVIPLQADVIRRSTRTHQPSPFAAKWPERLKRSEKLTVGGIERGRKAVDQSFLDGAGSGWSVEKLPSPRKYMAVTFA